MRDHQCAAVKAHRTASILSSTDFVFPARGTCGRFDRSAGSVCETLVRMSFLKRRSSRALACLATLVLHDPFAFKEVHGRTVRMNLDLKPPKLSWTDRRAMPKTGTL